MTDVSEGQWRWPLPDNWEPGGYWCVTITIPADQQYFDRLTGALGLLTLAKSWFPDPTRAGPKAVAQTWENALYLNMFSLSTDCPVFPSPPIPDQAAANDAAAAIFTVFVRHIVNELNSCAPTAGDCAGCVDSLMTELAPYGAGDAVRGALSRLCADLNASPGTRPNYDTNCSYIEEFNLFKSGIEADPNNWLNKLSSWMFNWLNNTADQIIQDLNIVGGLMGQGIGGFIADHGGIPSGGGASFGDDCAWAVDLDETQGQNFWHIISTGPYSNGTWTYGTGYQDTYDVLSGARRLYMELTAAVHYTSITVTYSIDTNPSGNGIDVREWDGVGGSSTVIAGGLDLLSPNTSYTDRQFTVALVDGAQNLWVDQNDQMSLTVTHLHIEGIGFNPWA